MKQEHFFIILALAVGITFGFFVGQEVGKKKGQTA